MLPQSKGKSSQSDQFRGSRSGHPAVQRVRCKFRFQSGLNELAFRGAAGSKLSQVNRPSVLKRARSKVCGAEISIEPVSRSWAASLADSIALLDCNVVGPKHHDVVRRDFCGPFACEPMEVLDLTVARTADEDTLTFDAFEQGTSTREKVSYLACQIVTTVRARQIAIGQECLRSGRLRCACWLNPSGAMSLTSVVIREWRTPESANLQRSEWFESTEQILVSSVR
jgi:hypothetical protein